MPNINLLPASADGTERSTDNANFNDTESTLASKDVVLIVTHGMCVVNGATSTIIKSGKGKL